MGRRVMNRRRRRRRRRIWKMNLSVTLIMKMMMMSCFWDQVRRVSHSGIVYGKDF
jgi:hypothetical protein